MFTTGETALAYFAELAEIEGSVPTCGSCGIPLSKTRFSTGYFDKAANIVSYWHTRCPQCKAPHVIFNKSSALPILIPKRDQKPPPDSGPADSGEALPGF